MGTQAPTATPPDSGDSTPHADSLPSAEFKRTMLDALPSLRAFAVSLIGSQDRADDLVQDAIMNAWAKHHSFQPGTNMKAWLITILRNGFYSQMRKAHREVQDSDGVMTERLSVHPSQYGQMEMRDFTNALAQLPDDQREAIILVGASGFSYEEAAEICGCALGTIKSRVNRARVRLQETMQIAEGTATFGPDAAAAAVVLR
jgi:RNA polymerase sigma-70 factor (ECF subfamily)